MNIQQAVNQELKNSLFEQQELLSPFSWFDGVVGSFKVNKFK